MAVLNSIWDWFTAIYDRVGAPVAASISADIAVVDLQVDKLAGTETTGTLAKVDNLAWQNVATIATGARHKIQAILLDMVNLTQNTNMRIQIEIDGANPRTVWGDTWLVAGDDGVLINVPRGINTDLTLDIQSTVLEGAVRNVPYNIIYEEME